MREHWPRSARAAQFGVYEKEIVVRALARIRPQERLASRFVMPWFVGIASLNRRNDMHQSGMLATLGKDFCDNVFFTVVRFADVLASAFT